MENQPCSMTFVIGTKRTPYFDEVVGVIGLIEEGKTGLLTVETETTAVKHWNETLIPALCKVSISRKGDTAIWTYRGGKDALTLVVGLMPNHRCKGFTRDGRYDGGNHEHAREKRTLETIFAQSGQGHFFNREKYPDAYKQDACAVTVMAPDGKAVCWVAIQTALVSFLDKQVKAENGKKPKASQKSKVKTLTAQGDSAVAAEVLGIPVSI